MAALALLGVDSTSTSVNFAVLSTCLRQCCCDIDPASNDDRFMNINELSIMNIIMWRNMTQWVGNKAM